MDISYSDGRTVKNAVIQIWDDHHTEARGNWYRAFWCASGDIDVETGSTVIGYCSFGGSHKTVVMTALEVNRLYPGVPIYRNGKLVKGLN